MNQWEFPGARWWKFDFHTHTPASYDFMSRCSQQDRDMFTVEHWLRKFMDGGIECIAITDHDSGGWIDRMQEKLEELREEKPPWFRPLYLFPGVEISANEDVHLLAIFGSDKREGDIERLLGAIGFRSGTNSAATKSVNDIIEEIKSRAGIAIPAHVDREKGILQLQGRNLLQWLDNENIYAMELWDDNYPKPQLFSDKKLNWVEVRGSDTHFNDSDASQVKKDGFGAFTWVKMDKPTIEGLRLALIDGTVSVNRDMNANPNNHAGFVIEELVVNQAKYIGRSGPLSCRFSPFLNTIIGGRGSGKSTLLEFIRLALRRDDELPPALEEESRKYFTVGNESLLIDESQISLIYRKGNVRYRLNWSAKGDVPSLEVEKQGEWAETPADVASLFSASIFSQKQIFELSREPQALLEVIDKAPDVRKVTFNERRRELESRYKQIEQKIQELNDKISQEVRLYGESTDLSMQINQIEETGHEKELQNFRERQQQISEIESLEGDWNEMTRKLEELRDSIGPTGVNEQYFTIHTDMLSAIEQTNGKWKTINDRLCELYREAQTIVPTWQAAKEDAIWMQELTTDLERYGRLRTQMRQQGIEPSKYHLLLGQFKDLQIELSKIVEYRTLREELEAEKQEVFEKLTENRKALSERRQKFLTDVLAGNSTVNIEVSPFDQAWTEVEKDLRIILQCPERYVRDFEDLEEIYRSSGDQKIEKLKATLQEIRSDEGETGTGWFVRRLNSLPPESMSLLSLWFPEDGLKITFGPKDQPIEQGSPGQKTAALLAFILSYGGDPLLLDQPEDDLDNELIYDLIVQQLRKAKSRRQVIIVTHNANIVVNGDAEMVFPLKIVRGETRVTRAASIQDKKVRQEICNILEGGQKAFDQRYKRIRLES